MHLMPLWQQPFMSAAKIILKWNFIVKSKYFIVVIVECDEN